MVNRSIRAVEDWRLSLMCIEWIDLPGQILAQEKTKHGSATRRVARRLDILRFGPSIRELLKLRPERIDIVLV